MLTLGKGYKSLILQMYGCAVRQNYFLMRLIYRSVKTYNMALWFEFSVLYDFSDCKKKGYLDG